LKRKLLSKKSCRPVSFEGQAGDVGRNVSERPTVANRCFGHYATQTREVCGAMGTGVGVAKERFVQSNRPKQ